MSGKEEIGGWVANLTLLNRPQCLLCIHKRNLQVGERTFHGVQCCHPKLIETQQRLPERRPGFISAKALNEMGKALNLKVHPDAYTRDRWFNWPWGYNPRKPSIVACSGFKKKHIKH